MSPAHTSRARAPGADPLASEAEFAGLHVVVTGGTGALGSAVVDRLLDAGATCHVPNFDPVELERFAHRDHERVRLVAGVDLADPGQVRQFYDRVPGLWAAIHCAGGFDMGPITELAPDAYQRLMRMNVDSCYLCCRAAVETLRARETSGAGPAFDGGRIVNVAARPGLEPRSGAQMVAYTMAKAAVAAHTQALAEEVAADGIWVNAIAPSIIDSPANRAAMPDADHSLWPTPEDLAETLCFLASPRNRVGRGGLVPVYGRS